MSTKQFPNFVQSGDVQIIKYEREGDQIKFTMFGFHDFCTSGFLHEICSSILISERVRPTVRHNFTTLISEYSCLVE